jgi:hypothetical protein
MSSKKVDKNGDLNIKIKVNIQDPEPLELIAQSIIQVAEGFEKIKKSSLTERAVCSFAPGSYWIVSERH